MENPSLRDSMDSTCPEFCFGKLPLNPDFKNTPDRSAGGCQLHVLDRTVFQPYRTGLELIRLIRDRYPDQFAWKEPPYEYEYKKLPIEILCGRPLAEIFPA